MVYHSVKPWLKKGLYVIIVNVLHIVCVSFNMINGYLEAFWYRNF